MNCLDNKEPIKLDACLPASVRENVYTTQGKDSKWGRLVLTWNEKLPDGKTKEHKYAAMVNRETGELFLDCRPHKLLAKCFTTTLGHPLMSIAKFGRDALKICKETHRKLNPMKEVAVPNTTGSANGIEGGSGSTKWVPDKKPPLCERFKIVAICIKDLLRDAARSTLYGIALPIISAVGTLVAGVTVLFALFKIRILMLENLLYNIREFSGKVEKAFQRGETSLTLAPCFQPENINRLIGSIKTRLGNDWNSKDFIEQFGQDESMRALNRWARNQLEYRRKNCCPFNDYGMKLNKKITYVSEAYKTMRDIIYEKAIGPLLIDPNEMRAVHAKAAAWSKI